MAVKKTTYINTELTWAEEQLVTWKTYVDANPLHMLKDRIEWKPTAKGGMLPMFNLPDFKRGRRGHRK